MKQITASLTVKALHETFCRFGIPESLKTDNGPQFISAELQRFCEEFGIEHRKTTPYWPQANGEVERINRTIGKHLKISQTNGSDWQWDLRMFILMHNSTPHSTTGVAPSVLMFGRLMKDKLPGLMVKGSKILEEIKDQDQQKKSKEAEYTDKKRMAKPSAVQVGDTVVAKNIQKENKLTTTFNPEEFDVIGREGTDVTLHSKVSGRVIHRNVSHLKRLTSDIDIPGNEELNDNRFNEQLITPQMDTTEVPQDNAVSKDTREVNVRPRREAKRPRYLNDYTINEFVQL